jgi:hypothetical protein
MSKIREMSVMSNLDSIIQEQIDLIHDEDTKKAFKVVVGNSQCKDSIKRY